MPLEKADISKLLATGWKPPMPIKMTAHDGKTDIYGLHVPSDELRSVEEVSDRQQRLSRVRRPAAPAAARSPPARGDRQALAELGFIVVTIDGMGTPGRSKAFQDAYYGAMGRDNTIPDQIAGHEGAGAAVSVHRPRRAPASGATRAAASRRRRRCSASPTSSRSASPSRATTTSATNEDDWGERYQGLLVKNADGTDNYDAEANQNFAKNLKGHLLLAHGTMDTNVPPYQTMLVADALIKANKDFDLLMIPNAEPRLRRGVELHDAAPLGLLREVADGRGAAEGVSDQVRASPITRWLTPLAADRPPAARRAAIVAA